MIYMSLLARLWTFIGYWVILSLFIWFSSNAISLFWPMCPGLSTIWSQKVITLCFPCRSVCRGKCWGLQRWCWIKGLCARANSAAQRKKESDNCSGLEERVQLQQDPQGSQKRVLLQWYCSPGSRARPGKMREWSNSQNEMVPAGCGYTDDVFVLCRSFSSKVISARMLLLS